MNRIWIKLGIAPRRILDVPLSSPSYQPDYITVIHDGVPLTYRYVNRDHGGWGSTLHYELCAAVVMREISGDVAPLLEFESNFSA